MNSKIEKAAVELPTQEDRTHKTCARQSRGSVARTGAFVIGCAGSLLFQPTQAASIADDLLKDAGQFDSSEIKLAADKAAFLESKGWIVVKPMPYDYTTSDGYLVMSKKADAEGFYNDGLTYLFKDATGLQEIRPRHIHFVVQTETATDMESCDFRFYSVKEKEDEVSGRLLNDDDNKQPEVTRAPAGPNAEYESIEFSDVAFFRLGYFDYAKLNTQNMLQKYAAATEYKIDLLMDWDEQRVSIYINDQEMKSAAFFTQRKDKLESANAISIYGLSPGSISKFNDLRVCQDICSTEAPKEFTDLSGATFGYNSAFSLVMGLSALYMSLLA